MNEMTIFETNDPHVENTIHEKGVTFVIHIKTGTLYFTRVPALWD